MATPILNWLRDVALAVRDGGYLGTWLRANDLVDIIAQRPDTELPGLPEGADLTDDEVKKKVLQAIGRRMAQCFGADSVRMIDSFQIARKETADILNRRTTREYCFQAVETSAEKCAYAPQGHRRTIGAEAPEHASGAAQPDETEASGPAEPALCAYGAPIGAPIAAPMKTSCAPIAPMGSVIAPMESQNSCVSENTCEIRADSREVIGTHRRIGAIGAPRGTVHFNPDDDEVLICPA
jgi:hypothetical protein